MRGATADAAGQPRSDQGGAHAPPDLQPRRANRGMAAALPHQAAGPDRAEPADGLGSLSLAGTDSGGLQPELRRQLRAIAERARDGDEPALAAPRLKPGTKLLRDWQGHAHEVLVSDEGFVWQQARYRSLSQIARAITGTRWSGPVFFGLKPRKAHRAHASGE